MMKIEPFALERYFAEYEFSARYLLSCSDCEALSMNELVEMADPDSRRLWENLTMGYTETLGHPVLREAIAAQYSGIEAEQILVAAPEEAIFLFMQAVLEPGDHMVCTFPGYQSLYEVGRSIGCEVSFWEPDESSGWYFDIEKLQNLLRDNTRLVVVNFPHNPTGALPSPDEYARLVEYVREKGAYLFSDEMYRFLEFDTSLRLPSGCELYDKAISLSGLSKSFGLPGLRIGWVASQQVEILDRMSRLKDYTTICNSAPSEILALMALRSRDRIISLQRSRIQKNIGLLEDFLARYDHCFSWNRPLAGSISFPRLLLEDDSFEFCRRLVQQTGIMLVPSRMFNYGDHHVRIGFGRDSLPEVLEQFGDYLDKEFSG